jgi:thiol:disulfide interchange protein DsbC
LKTFCGCTAATFASLTLLVFIMIKWNVAALLLACASFASAPAFASPHEGMGCGAGSCRECHALSKQEASALLKDKVGEVLDVKFSEVPGLWDVDAVYEGQKVPLYLDFSKKYLISGSVIKLANNEDLSERKFVSMNRVDVSKISLDDAVVIGKADAAGKIVVFDDPECSFCAKLHPEMKKVVTEHPELAFFIKLFPLPKHKGSPAKAKAIACVKSKGDNSKAEAMLADALSGKSLPEPTCDTEQIDKNIMLARELHIATTPTLIMPDGRVLPGFKDADKIVAAVNEEVGKDAKK